MNIRINDTAIVEVLGASEQGPQGVPGPPGPPGPNGPEGQVGTGWSAITALIVDGARVVEKVVDWVGGSGFKPVTNVYVGASGFTGVIAEAVDVRGAQGASGAGPGDMLKSENLLGLTNTTTARSNIGLGTADTPSFSQLALTTAPVASTHAVPKSYVDAMPRADCYLSYAATTQLVLSRVHGKYLYVGGTHGLIAAGGIVLTNAGAAANTLYYVYAYNNAGNIALELSTNSFTFDGNGVRTKGGDDTRTLVGMVFTNNSGQFAADITTASYFNRRTKSGLYQSGPGIAVSGPPWRTIDASAILNFVSWDDEDVLVSCQAPVINDATSAEYTYLGVDVGGSVQLSTYAMVGAAAVALACSGACAVGNGKTTATLVGGTDGGSTATYGASYMRMNVTTRG